MNNPRLASRYAKSIVDLAVEMNQLDAVYGDMKMITAICKSNPDFVALLRSPVIKAGTKGKILEAIIKNRIGEITAGFIRLLVNKARESNLPEIAQAVVEQHNKVNNIHNIKITTAAPISEALKNSILDKVKETSAAAKFQLETVVDEELIGGFLLETDGRLVDASILSDLKDIRKHFQKNDFLHRIR